MVNPRRENHKLSAKEFSDGLISERDREGIELNCIQSQNQQN